MTSHSEARMNNPTGHEKSTDCQHIIFYLHHHPLKYVVAVGALVKSLQAHDQGQCNLMDEK